MSLIDDYALETITITKRLSTYTIEGAPDYAGQTIKTTTARVMDAKEKRFRLDGAVLEYDRIFWLLPEDEVVDGDRITLGGINHEVVAVERRQFLDGTVDHYRAMVRIGGLR